MWLLLVAGTGYLARCWQKAFKCKSGFRCLKHNAGLHLWQSSPSCTPRRARWRTVSRRGTMRRSQSAKNRELLPGRCEGRLARCPARDRDDGIFGSSEKSYEGFFSCGDDDDTSGQVQTCPQANDLHENNRMEPYISLSPPRMQDLWKEPFLCKETSLPLTTKLDTKEPHSDDKPIFEALHGCFTPVLDFLNDQLKMVASSSRNWVDCIKPVETGVTDLRTQRLRSPPSCLQVLRMTKERTCASCASKVTNLMGRKWCLQSADSGRIQSPLYDKALWKHSSEKEMGKSSERDKNACALDSNLFKGVLNSEYLNQPYRWDCLMTNCRGGNDHKNAVPCLVHCAGLGTAVNLKKTRKGGTNRTNHRKSSKGQQAIAFRKPTNSSTAHLFGSNESAFIALGMAMGVASVASGCKSQLEDLNTILKKMSLTINDLKEQIVYKNDDRTVVEFSSMELYDAEYNDELITAPENDLHDGLNELEAELEAELQRMELQVYSSDVDEPGWRQIQAQQESQQSEHGDGLYMDNGIHDSMPVQDDSVYVSDFVVPPLELERRLWEVVEQRHKDTICELQNELRTINERFAAKEVEVQWWKDRVWWLMETCLGGKKDDSE